MSLYVDRQNQGMLVFLIFFSTVFSSMFHSTMCAKSSHDEQAFCNAKMPKRDLHTSATALRLLLTILPSNWSR
jgi:hypothetical protein